MSVVIDDPPRLTRPLRVLHIIDSLGVGGAERGVARLVEASVGGPIQYTIATLRPRPDSVLEDSVQAAGARLVTFPMTSRELAGARPAPVALLRLLRFVRREDFDVIHTHLNTSDVVGALAGFVGRVPVISTQHSTHRRAPNPMRERIRRWVLRNVAVEVLAVGESAAEAQSAELGGRPVTVIPNPFLPAAPPDPGARVRIRSELGVRDDQPVLLAAGRLEPQKDHLLLLDALRLVLDRRPDVVLLIAGTGALAEALGQRAQDLGCAGSVHLLGHRDDIDDLYSAADLLVSSSAKEGMPQSMFEAMAVGLQIVATDVGDCAEVIGPGGEVVPPGDADALARAIIDGLEPRTRAARAVAMQQRADQGYGIDTWVAQFNQVYERAALAPSP